MEDPVEDPREDPEELIDLDSKYESESCDQWRRDPQVCRRAWNEYKYESTSCDQCFKFNFPMVIPATETPEEIRKRFPTDHLCMDPMLRSCWHWVGEMFSDVRTGDLFRGTLLPEQDRPAPTDIFEMPPYRIPLGDGRVIRFHPLETKGFFTENAPSALVGVLRIWVEDTLPDSQRRLAAKLNANPVWIAMIETAGQAMKREAQKWKYEGRWDGDIRSDMGLILRRFNFPSTSSMVQYALNRAGGLPEPECGLPSLGVLVTSYMLITETDPDYHATYNPLANKRWVPKVDRPLKEPRMCIDYSQPIAEYYCTTASGQCTQGIRSEALKIQTACREWWESMGIAGIHSLETKRGRQTGHKKTAEEHQSDPMLDAVLKHKKTLHQWTAEEVTEGRGDWEKVYKRLKTRVTRARAAPRGNDG